MTVIKTVFTLMNISIYFETFVSQFFYASKIKIKISIFSV